MTAVTAVVWLTLLATAVGLEVAGRAGHGPATAGRTTAALMRSTPGRVLLLAGWLWIGVHFLAR